MNLNFNHPVKELVWAGVRANTVGVSSANLYDKDPISTGPYKLKLNGHDDFLLEIINTSHVCRYGNIIPVMAQQLK